MEENNNNNTNESSELRYDYNTDYNYTPSKNYNEENKDVMSVGEWLLVILATLIPCVGLVLYLVWAFGENGNQNRKNYCRAWLIYWVISAVLGFILLMIFLAFLVPAVAGGSYYYTY